MFLHVVTRLALQRRIYKDLRVTEHHNSEYRYSTVYVNTSQHSANKSRQTEDVGVCCMQIQWAIFQRVNIITEEKGKTGMKGKKKKRILPKNKTQKGKMQYKKYFLGKHTCGCTLNCHECYHLLSGECENKTCLLKIGNFKAYKLILML